MNQPAIRPTDLLDQDVSQHVAASKSESVNKPQKSRAGSKSYKIQIQLSERAKERLFELVERTEAESAAQVVRDALRIYDILFEELAENEQELLLKSKQSDEVVRLRLF